VHAEQQKVVTGVLVDRDCIAVLALKELEIWRQTNALGGHDHQIIQGILSVAFAPLRRGLCTFFRPNLDLY
jgi:hypothetical protein